MGETCLHVPARVFGFESTVETAGQPQRSLGQLEHRASLLSALLKGSHPPIPSAFMDTSDAYSEVDDDDMEDAEGEDTGANEEELLLAAAGGSAPVPIPSTSEAFLKAQREALKRFVYVHQIEDMRRQCAAYFTRQARFQEVQATAYTVEQNPHAPTVPVEMGGPVLTVPQPPTWQRMPGF